MCSQSVLQRIVYELSGKLREIFPERPMDFILFGSYARHDADEGPDVDIMILVDASREEIRAKGWSIGEAAGDLLLDFGVVVSPVVENREYFLSTADYLPFFKSIKREGVQMSA